MNNKTQNSEKQRLARIKNGRANKTHGKSRNNRAYIAWASMKSRCYNKNATDFEIYGGRGVSVCAEWKHSFENFFSCMGSPPTKNHSLDRINTNGNYSPDNCRWATKLQQSANRRKNIMIIINGKSKCLSEWARIKGVPMYLAYDRYRRGVSAEKMFLKRFLRHGEK